jgi:magnesium transporter
MKNIRTKVVIKDPNELLKQLDLLHPTDIASSLKKIKKNSSDDFYFIIENIPENLLGEVLLELPESLRDDAYKSLSSKELSSAAHELETDDAVDLIQDIEDVDKQKAREVLNGLEDDEQEDIEWLKKYEDDEAGAFMQTELFAASADKSVQEAIDILKISKETGELENVHKLFITDKNQSLINAILLEDLIIMDKDRKLEDILLDQKYQNNSPISVEVDEDIQKIVKLFEQYNLSVVAVTGYKGRLLGRITSDDIIDVIEQQATEQMYQLAGVDEDYEHEDNLLETTKNRGFWLFINLLTAILASLVIGLFDETLQKYIPLAILMPIVASMGGNSGTQSLAVTVRQLALGDIDYDNSKDAVKKEILISILNGLTFAFIIGAVAVVWFGNPMLGVVIGLSTIINLFAAGFFGSTVPLILKKFDIDPAVGSTVILTTVTDIVGFFSFLGLARVILL